MVYKGIESPSLPFRYHQHLIATVSTFLIWGPNQPTNQGRFVSGNFGTWSPHDATFFFYSLKKSWHHSDCDMHLYKEAGFQPAATGCDTSLQMAFC